MLAVAISGFHHEEIGPGNHGRVFDYGLFGLAQVTGKYQLRGLFSFDHLQIHNRRTDDMTGIEKPDLYIVPQSKFLLIGHGDEMLQRLCRIVQRIDGLHWFLTAPLIFAVEGFRIGLLNEGRIRQHNLRQITGGLRGIHRALKAVLDEFRNQTAMVHMSMGENDRLNPRRIKGKILII